MKKLWRAAVLLALACGASAALSEDIEIALSRQPDRSYEVSGAFVVEASSAVVWSVLTDYEHLGEFVSGMRRSRVTGETPEGALLVEQEAVGGVFVFSKTVKVLLEIRHERQRLSFKDVGRSHFWDYSGSWSAREAPGGVEVSYRLTMIPDFIVPPFMLRSGMKTGARELLGQVRAEIRRRAADPRPS